MNPQSRSIFGRVKESFAASYRRHPGLVIGVPLAVVSAMVIMIVWAVFFRPTPPVTPPAASSPEAAPPLALGGRYADLLPGQKRLVDDWVGRYSRVVGRPVDPAGLYDGLPLSTRTTFNGVTHALDSTTLIDSEGRSLGGTALDLVARVNTVAGQVPGAGGDRQFRIYVEMRPGARETIEKSREFRRDMDNTIYHKGYPICFRGMQKAPALQVSLTRDSARADIDVDYRSSSFPVMLVNGHLTSSNSDVRAGDNDYRHNGSWPGLSNWWRRFLGLPLVEVERPTAAAEGITIAREPRLKDVDPQEAIYDFLRAWLVEQRPDVAAGYLSTRGFACPALEQGMPPDRGMARFMLARGMGKVNERVGKIADLAEVSQGATLNDTRSRLVQQPHAAEFLMYDLRNDMAAEFDCESRLNPEQATPSKDKPLEFGTYIGAVFRLKMGQITGRTVRSVWTKEKGAWALVAYDVEPETETGEVPAVGSATPAAETVLSVVPGDSGMTRAAKGFHEALFLRKDPNAAVGFLSDKCYACYDVYRPEDAPIANSVQEARELLLQRLKLLGDWAGPAKQLDEVLVAAEPNNPDIKLVKHSQDRAFAIVSVPDSIAATFDCSQMKEGKAVRMDSAGSPVYGHYYAAGFRVKAGGPDAAVLWTLWAKDGPTWKMVSYAVIAP